MLSLGETSPKYTPVLINFSLKNLNPGSESWLSTSKNVRQALEEHGFFAAVGDDNDKLIPEELSNGMLRELETLFSLPKETKKRNTSTTSSFNGYKEPAGMAPLMESLSIEESTSPEAVDNFTKLMWPSSGNNNFCEVVNIYAKTALEMRQTVSRMVFDSYGLNDSYYDSCNNYFTHNLRFNKYFPPQSDEYEIGCIAHTDKGFFTILHQINQVHRLQIRPKDKDYWVTVDVPPHSLLVFSGESLKAWSNERIHVTMHRVLMHGEEMRYSIAQFSHLKITVQVPEELVDDEHPLQQKEFNCLENLQIFGDKFHKDKDHIKPCDEF